MLYCAIEPYAASVLPPADLPSEAGLGLQTMRTGGRRVPVSDNGLGQVLGKRQPAGGQGPGRLSANRAERKLLSALELDSTWGLRQPFRARGCNGGRVGIPSRTRGRSSGPPSAFPEVRGAASLNPHPQLRGSYSLTTVLLHGGENSTAKKTQVNQSRYSFLTSAPGRVFVKLCFGTSVSCWFCC